MTRHVALLRGVNLGSHNRLKMPELVEAFEAAGFTNVKTYVQSGNIAFDTNAKAGLDETIHNLIQSEFKLDVPVVTRASSEIQAIIDAQPFKSAPANWHVTLLATKPDASAAKSIGADVGGQDSWRLIGRDVYLDIAGGYGATKLSNNLFERKLGTVATTRNWKTMLALANL